MSVGKNPSPTPPQKGEGLWRRVLPSTARRVASAGLLPPCGGDGRQAREGLRATFLMLVLLLTPIHAFAVNPDEVLADPVLEHRARTISAELRCMVCQNQSIDDSNAELARDLRVVVRERLVNGDTDEQVLDYVVSRYGEFVLLKPRLSLKTLALWGAPAALVLVGLIVAFVSARRRAVQPSAKLSAEEEARLGKLLDGE